MNLYKSSDDSQSINQSYINSDRTWLQRSLNVILTKQQ